MKVKNRLKEIRLKEYMMSSGEFSKKLGIPLSTYSQWESGTNVPTIAKALDISKKLNKSIEQIWYSE